MTAIRLIAGVAALGVALAGFPGTSTAIAAGPDYRFELAGKPQPSGDGKEIVGIRLIHLPDGKPVTDAVIFESRADMGPQGMPTMTAPIAALPAGGPGLYRFAVEPTMSGTWALTLAAKVQGETETVRGTVDVALVK